MNDRLRSILQAHVDDLLAFGVADLFRVERREDAEPLAGCVAAPAAGPGGASPASDDAASVLEAVAREAAVCTACGLCKTRTKTVPGEGSPAAEILFVGEAPGRDEDLSGRPFVGRAGQLLTRMIEAMGLRREDAFIANVLKCRPPGNRDPDPEEAARCLPFLRRQLDAIRPRVVIALGGHAMRGLLPGASSVGAMRGRVHEYAGASLVVTYHPSYLLRDPERKRDAWEDLKLALRVLGRQAPPARPPRRS